MRTIGLCDLIFGGRRTHLTHLYPTDTSSNLLNFIAHEGYVIFDGF